MEHLTRTCASAFLDRWQAATITDFGHLMLAVVLLGWFLARMNSR